LADLAFWITYNNETASYLGQRMKMLYFRCRRLQVCQNRPDASWRARVSPCGRCRAPAEAKNAGKSRKMPKRHGYDDDDDDDHDGGDSSKFLWCNNYQELELLLWCPPHKWSNLADFFISGSISYSFGVFGSYMGQNAQKWHILSLLNDICHAKGGNTRELALLHRHTPRTCTPPGCL